MNPICADDTPSSGASALLTVGNADSAVFGEAERTAFPFWFVAHGVSLVLAACGARCRSCRR